MPLGRFTLPSANTADQSTERHATWLELFFDLVFVVAISELGHLLAEELSIDGLLAFGVLFVPVWWVWLTHTYYGDVFDTGDLLYSSTTLLTMFGVLLWSTTFRDVFHGDVTVFVVGYLALRLLNTLSYLVLGRLDAARARFTDRFALGYGVGFVFWIGSLLVDGSAQYLLWTVGLAIEVMSSPVVYVLTPDSPQQESHMDERFGLFTIIVLGESILAVASGAADLSLEIGTFTIAAFGFALAVCFWWLYFEYADPTVVRAAVHSTPETRLRATALWVVYGYGHVLLHGSVALTAVGVGAALASFPDGGVLTVSARIALYGGTAVFLAGLVVVQSAAPEGLPRNVVAVRLAAVVLVVVVAVLPSATDTATVAVGWLTLVASGDVLFERTRPRSTR